MSNLNINNVKVDIGFDKVYGPMDINIKFLNGEVTIPKYPGGYVIASGCGSGKTTAIKEIIRKCYQVGIVYSAFTIDECNEMYKFCKTFVNDEDIVVLHSKYQDDGVDNSLLRNTDKLAEKKIIICTHYRLLNEYPSVLLKYSGSVLRKDRFSRIVASTMRGWDSNGEIKLPRRLILIDEMPVVKSPSINVTKSMIRLLGVAETEIKIDPETKESYVAAKYPIVYTNGGNRSTTDSLYNMNSNDPLFKDLKTNTESDKLRTELALDMIYDSYDQLMNMKNDSVELTFTIANYINNLMDTRFIIFDGTGDLTFINSKFDLINVNNKYSSSINAKKFEFNIKRTWREKDFNRKLNDIFNDLDNSIERVKDYIKENKGTLIVTWKDFKVSDNRRGLPILGEFDKREVSIKDYIRFKLNESGFIEGKDFSIIHYQSGLDRATNEFREYSGVVFLGEFHVPNEVVAKFNRDYRSNTNPQNYLTYQLVQAVCRTRIRLHQGLPINVYFSSDWSDDVIKNCIKYLDRDEVSNVIDETLSYIKPKWRPVIKLFSSLDEEFKYAIENKLPYKFNFTLDEIYELIPMYEKKVKWYNPLVNYLGKLGIELNIKSEIGRNQYSKIK
jgi:hypothetical protein